MRRDIILGAICGELTALFLLFVVKNPYVEEFKEILVLIGNRVWFLLIVLPFCFALGIWVAGFLSRFVKVFFQLAKFLEIGVLNTLIDLGILNLLVWLTGVFSGTLLAPLNTASFLLAATNSYYWNKFWAFRNNREAGGKEFAQFLVISGIGWGINTAIVVLGTTFLASIFSVSPGALVNIMKLTATFFAMTWNFIGYKFIVFKR